MKLRFTLTDFQKEKASVLQEAFKACKEAGIDFILTENGLQAFCNPGIQISRPYLGDDYPDEEAGEEDVTEDLQEKAVVITNDFFEADNMGDIIFLSDNQK